MFFAKLHPLLVHFPMALLFSGALFKLFGCLQREDVILEAGGFNIKLGFWFLPIAMGVGGLGILDLELNSLAHKFLIFHIRYAFGTLFVFGTYLIMQKFRGKLWAEILLYLLLVAGVITVFLTGFYGAELVHRFNVPTKGI